METEQIVLLDEDYRPIGSAPKLASHHADTPLHLAFSCYVFDSNGRVLITRRAEQKKVWPGIWTNSCCGHPAPAEPIEQAVNRRLQYELGMTVNALNLALPDFRYRCEFNGIVENEYCPVYIARATCEPSPNPEEVGEYSWLSWEELKAEVNEKPDKYSYWCKMQIPLLEAGGFLPATD
jgi:isopentenyl-diphosphate Delta-isomerase